MKYIAFALVALTLVVVGAATIEDLVRSGAARVGISISSPNN